MNIAYWKRLLDWKFVFTEHVGATITNIPLVQFLCSLENQQADGRHLLSSEAEVPKYIKRSLKVFLAGCHDQYSYNAQRKWVHIFFK